MHICGICGKKFKTEKEYLNHICKVTGHKPTEVEHLDKTSGGTFSLQAQKALERGNNK